MPELEMDMGSPIYALNRESDTYRMTEQYQ